jgi:hypothetical protein
MAKSTKNANYDFAKQKAPPSNMGGHAFANMPEAPMIRAYGPGYDLRDGLVNDFVNNIEKTSKIPENQR